MGPDIFGPSVFLRALLSTQELLQLTRINCYLEVDEYNSRRFLRDAITHVCPNFNGTLPKPLMHGLVITFNIFAWM